MDLGLIGKRALVSDASRRLGAAIAQALVPKSVTVSAALRSTDVTESWVAALLTGQRGRVCAAKHDLRDLTSVEALADRLIVDGGFDILIGNSGGTPPGKARDANRTDWLTHFEGIAANHFHLAQRLLPGMTEPNGIRAAVIGWLKTLASEVAGSAVTVDVALPGRIYTERVDQLDDAAVARSGGTREGVAQQSITAIPTGRSGKPHEFTGVVTFLANELRDGREDPHRRPRYGDLTLQLGARWP